MMRSINCRKNLADSEICFRTQFNYKVWLKHYRVPLIFMSLSSNWGAPVNPIRIWLMQLMVFYTKDDIIS